MAKEYKFTKAPTNAYLLRRRDGYGTNKLYLIHAETPNAALEKHLTDDWYDATGAWEVYDAGKLPVLAAFNVTEAPTTESEETV